eukprot:CAMPEP_0204233490 /NCGR_PEP_ID=MMETSP0361-20130328/90236_1 /ASSEMBLY_ACC=CAM_ASM_000343 /TAXON_ID=268821 /ORGANISM="Scrippsiella Hangoei, Strain SHTV-5" /LENGTH=150 /DNA_ID=CAMNT_0051203963 /DNA_START=37 /DNA_END=485 /DNA_ORIENTATION=+
MWVLGQAPKKDAAVRIQLSVPWEPDEAAGRKSPRANCGLLTLARNLAASATLHPPRAVSTSMQDCTPRSINAWKQTNSSRQRKNTPQGHEISHLKKSEHEACTRRGGSGFKPQVVVLPRDVAGGRRTRHAEHACEHVAPGRFEGAFVDIP